MGARAGREFNESRLEGKFQLEINREEKRVADLREDPPFWKCACLVGEFSGEPDVGNYRVGSYL